MTSSEQEKATPEQGPEEAATEIGERAGKPLAPGVYFVSTPIGTARDITLRGLDILRNADVLAAEDTRTLRHLMEIHGVPLGGRPLIAYHEHNGTAAAPRLFRWLERGASIAYASDAGTPLVSDPGFQLGRAAIAAGYRVFAAPGASAVLAALTVSGLPTDRFLFAGFPPASAGTRRNWLRDFTRIPATLVFYESPKRVGEMLSDLVQLFGEDRRAVVCRELTKRFEDVQRGTLAELAEKFSEGPVRGEIVVLVDRPGAETVSDEQVQAALKERLERMSRKDAVAEVTEMLGLPRRTVYQAALALEKGE